MRFLFALAHFDIHFRVSSFCAFGLCVCHIGTVFRIVVFRSFRCILHSGIFIEIYSLCFGVVKCIRVFHDVFRFRLHLVAFRLQSHFLVVAYFKLHPVSEKFYRIEHFSYNIYRFGTDICEEPTATRHSSAVSPGDPTRFSIHLAMYWPWSPPVLKLLFGNNGVMNLASVTEAHTIMIVMQINHFDRFIMYTLIIFNDIIIRNVGIRNAAMPKQRFTK